MWQNISHATTRRAIRRLFAAYLFVAGLALAFPHRPASWLTLAVLHAVAITVLLRPGLLTPIASRIPRISSVIADWYALVVIPAMYTELAVLNVSIFNGRFFDSIILGWEQSLFGGQPSRELAHKLPYLPLSEYLHFAYISYYLIIYGPPLYLYLKGRREDQQHDAFNLLLAFFAHYVFFIYFPVQGPRYLFPPPSGPISQGFFYKLAHKLLEAGSARGAAFPSSHVGVSIAQSAFTFTVLPRLAPFVLFLAVSLALGAIYGGFHYATDALCGALFGLFLFSIAPKVARLLGRRADA